MNVADRIVRYLENTWQTKRCGAIANDIRRALDLRMSWERIDGICEEDERIGQDGSHRFRSGRTSPVWRLY